MIYVLATRNRHKIREIKTILSDLPLELKTLDDFSDFPDPEENAPTLEGNALIKARAVCQCTGLPAIADDTGLEVDALDGRPGVHSARYAGPECSGALNMQKLLSELSEVPDERRTARFRCVIAVCGSNLADHTVEGIVEGRIARVADGQHGFGYDPVFVPLGYDRTFAELSAEKKNKISHRGRALAELKKYLRQE